MGLVYRNGESVMILLDFYDITNKAILCNPAFNPSHMRWFKNSFHKIKIEPDDHEMRTSMTANPMAFERRAQATPPSGCDWIENRQTYHSSGCGAQTPPPSIVSEDSRTSWMTAPRTPTPTPSPSVGSAESGMSWMAQNVVPRDPLLVDVPTGHMVPVLVDPSSIELLQFVNRWQTEVKYQAAYFAQYLPTSTLTRRNDK